jgi:hypothetical protein
MKAIIIEKKYSLLLVIILYAFTPGRALCQIYATTQSISGTVNSYARVTAIATGTCPTPVTLTVSSSAGFANGNKVMIIQMKSPSVYQMDSAQFGSILDIGNVGNYEFSRINTVSGTSITLQYPLVKTYTPSNLVQLVSVPEYNAGVTVSALLTAQAWNGTTGGVLAFDATTVLLNANISVEGQGFRGATDNSTGALGVGDAWRVGATSCAPCNVDSSCSSWGNKNIACADVYDYDDPMGLWLSRCSGTWRALGNTGSGATVYVKHCYGCPGGTVNGVYYPWGVVTDPYSTASAHQFSTNINGGVNNGFCSGWANAAENSGEKGEGIYTPLSNQTHGRGAIANGAGGGNEHNGGGGGGSNYGAGGMGGLGYTSAPLNPASKGRGGWVLDSYYSSNKIFMGGGGGAGQANNNEGTDGSNGGGIIIINALTSLNFNGYTITADGADNVSVPPGAGNDGAGGGSGGGVVLLNVPSAGYLGTINVSAEGGNGASQYSTDTRCYGPGGGGGGGVIWFSGAVPAGGTKNVNGGIKGSHIYNLARACVTVSEEENGNAGGILSGLVLPGSTSCTLPVEMQSFEVHPQGLMALLKWITSNEINNSYFEIERSRDAKIFESLGSVNSAGSGNSPTEYKFLDQNSIHGISYYRIKQVDFDGKISYSTIRSINFNNYIIHVYPNPISQDEILIIDYYAEKESSVKFFLSDVLGRILISHELTHADGLNSSQIALKSLSSGVYVLALSISNKSEFYRISIK